MVRMVRFRFGVQVSINNKFQITNPKYQTNPNDRNSKLYKQLVFDLS